MYNTQRRDQQNKTVLSEHQILSNWLNLVWWVLRTAAATAFYRSNIAASEEFLSFSHCHLVLLTLSIASLFHANGPHFFSLPNFWLSLFVFLSSRQYSLLVWVAHMCSAEACTFKSALIFSEHFVFFFFHTHIQTHLHPYTPKVRKLTSKSVRFRALTCIFTVWLYDACHHSYTIEMWVCVFLSSLSSCWKLSVMV